MEDQDPNIFILGLFFLLFFYIQFVALPCLKAGSLVFVCSIGLSLNRVGLDRYNNRSCCSPINTWFTLICTILQMPLSVLNFRVAGGATLQISSADDLILAGTRHLPAPVVNSVDHFWVVSCC
jgi:hypothetical protein